MEIPNSPNNITKKIAGQAGIPTTLDVTDVEPTLRTFARRRPCPKRLWFCWSNTISKFSSCSCVCSFLYAHVCISVQFYSFFCVLVFILSDIPKIVANVLNPCILPQLARKLHLRRHVERRTFLQLLGRFRRHSSLQWILFWICSGCS